MVGTEHDGSQQNPIAAVLPRYDGVLSASAANIGDCRPKIGVLPNVYLVSLLVSWEETRAPPDQDEDKVGAKAQTPKEDTNRHAAPAVEDRLCSLASPLA